MKDQGVDLSLLGALAKKTEGSSGRSKVAARYERLSREDEEFLRELEQCPQLGSLSIEAERARMRSSQTAAMREYPVEAREIQTSACTVHLIRAIQTTVPAPVVFFLHGGGWVLGDLATHMKLVCELALRSGCVIAFIDYPRAPEHPFPAPLEACATAVYEVLQSAGMLGLDAQRFAIGGDSSGGNLAAALTLLAIERDLVLPKCQFLLYPVTNYGCTTSSYKELSTNPNLSQDTMKWFWGHYLQDQSLGTDPRVSPLNAHDAMLSQSPPTLIVTCEYDVLRDEGEQFAARLVASGVEVTAIRWLGALHGFLVTESLAASTSAQTCIDAVAAYLRRELCQV
jgi:acetyl esterase